MKINSRYILLAPIFIFVLFINQNSPVWAGQDISKMSALERKGYINAVYARGKALYDQGNKEEAFKQWGLIEPYLDAVSPKKKAIDSFRSGSGVSAPVVKKVETSPMTAVFSEATEKVIKLQSVPAPVAAALSASDIFDQGKGLYFEGRVDEAMETWRTLKPLLTPGSPEAVSLDEMLSAYDRSKNKSSSVSQTSAVLKDVPSDFSGFISRVSQKIKLDITEEDAKSQNLATTQTQSSKDFEQVLLNAKAQYDAGNIEQCFSILEENKEKFAAYPEIREQIVLARQDLGKLASIRGKNEALASKPMVFVVPSGFDKFLEDARSRAQEQIKTGAVNTELLEESFNDRQVWVTFTFQDGKKLYDKGDYCGALKEWQSMTSYIEDGSRYAALIEQGMSACLEAPSAVAGNSVSLKGGQVKAPKDLEGLIRGK